MQNYRSWCYEAISKPFWEIANQIKIEPGEYYRDGNDEHDMRAYLQAHVHTNWIEVAISGDDVDDNENQEDEEIDEKLIFVDSNKIRWYNGSPITSILLPPQ